ncbi:hypothetical protein [Frigidibacter sp. ROC022]|uniref:hypothetical protein n=1 Tax=Frigidibacter sp. ROC022 TaxID=2971796 RepID=UPI00215B3AA0|nr:hypothetical protein [Frigidibacter sp. ROC022]MCR8724201.1 hypothetical protein [Frigidibacter sp. ROC022]
MAAATEPTTAGPGIMPGPSGTTGLLAVLLALGLTIGPASPVRAQDQGMNAPAPAAAPPSEAGRPSPEQVLALVAEGEALLAAGDLPGAEAKLREANDATFLFTYSDPLVKFYPNLAFARFYRRTGDWRQMVRYAASVASALETAGLGTHPYRIEALLYQGAALYEIERRVEAEPLLRSAFGETRDRPEMAGLHELATYYLARVLSDLKAPDAAEIRNHLFDLEGSTVTIAQVAAVVYEGVLALRRAGADPDRLARQMAGLVEALEDSPGFDPLELARYRSYLGLLLSNAYRDEEALELFRQVHRTLTEAGAYDSAYYWNVQRLAMETRILGDPEAARRLLQSELAALKERGAGPFFAAVYLGNLGEFSEVLGEPAVAQRYYREAYAELRKMYPASHKQVREMRDRIDRSAEDILAFSFAGELGVVQGLDYSARADASDTLRMFLQGDFVALELAQDEARAATGDNALSELNRAMLLGLSGTYDGAMEALAQARRLAVIDPGTLSPQAPILDLTEALALLWGSGHDLARAPGVLALAGAKAGLMSDAERSLYLALELCAAYQAQAPQAEVLAALGRWQAEAGPQPGPLGMMARLLVLEAAGPVAETEAMRALLDGLQAEARTSGMHLAGSLAEMLYLTSVGYEIANETTVPRLTLLEHDLSLGLPEHHLMLVAARIGLSNALDWRDRTLDSLDWLRRASEDLRLNPFHAPDHLAFLLAQQANIFASQGDVAIGATLAQQAYQGLDPARDRPGFAVAVIRAYAGLRWEQSGDPALAEEVYRRHVEDAAFLARLGPQDRARLLQDYAETIWDIDYPAAEALFVRAAAALAEAETLDSRSQQSSILFSRAIAAYFNGHAAAAWRAMTEANDLRRTWARDQIAAGAVAAIGGSDRNRAAWEAAIGWDYAQSLAE